MLIKKYLSHAGYIRTGNLDLVTLTGIETEELSRCWQGILYIGSVHDSAKYCKYKYYIQIVEEKYQGSL